MRAEAFYPLRPDDRIRVVNARGKVSPRGGLGIAEGFQRHLLEEEGVSFDTRGRIDLERFGWDPVGTLPVRSVR
ncbi:MAG TPA: hypothetical protein VGR07_00695 [Thermoanaerobaculia bacterium]|nr:hypothetical protein [Thermoanaerobaculia bacterium]